MTRRFLPLLAVCVVISGCVTTGKHGEGAASGSGGYAKGDTVIVLVVDGNTCNGVMKYKSELLFLRGSGKPSRLLGTVLTTGLLGEKVSFGRFSAQAAANSLDFQCQFAAPMTCRRVSDKALRKRFGDKANHKEVKEILRKLRRSR